MLHCYTSSHVASNLQWEGAKGCGDLVQKVLHLKLERFLCPNSLEIQKKHMLNVYGQGLLSISVQKSASYMLETWYFPYSTCPPPLATLLYIRNTTN